MRFGTTIEAKLLRANWKTDTLPLIFTVMTLRLTYHFRRIDQNITINIIILILLTSDDRCNTKTIQTESTGSSLAPRLFGQIFDHF